MTFNQIGKIPGKIRLAALAAAVAVLAIWAVAPQASAQTPTVTPTATPPALTVSATPTATPPALTVSATPQPPTPAPQPPTPAAQSPTPAPQPPTPQPQPAATAPQARDCQIRQGMQTRLQSILDTITSEQDGHVEVSFRNPGANDCAVDADLGVSVPTNIIISSKDGSSGTAGKVNFIVSDIRPGLERSISMDFKCLVKGEYTINFSGSYWPSGDKSRYQPITLHQRLICKGVSPTPTPAPPPPPPTPINVGATPVSPPPDTTPLPPDTPGPEIPWLLIAGGGLVFALIVIVALVALGRKSD